MVVEGGRFDWSATTSSRSSASPAAAYHGLRFHETFGNFALTVRNKAIGLRDMGPCLSPFNAFLILQGVETLPLRMERHVANADKVADWLDGPPAGDLGLLRPPAAEPHALLDKYCPNGVGSVFTFGVKGGYEMGVKIVDGCQLLSATSPISATPARSSSTRPRPRTASSTPSSRWRPAPARTWCGCRSGSRPSTTSSPTSTRR